MSKGDRDTFETSELSIALSHYDLGVVESVTDFARGSRRSPKVGIVAERGKFLLKRRAARAGGGDLTDRVRFAHRVQQRLGEVGFPLARLVTTREGKRTFVSLREHVYELFEFVPGQAYRRTTGETVSAGEVLARFHEAMKGFAASTTTTEPRGSYHDAPSVRTGLCRIGSTLSSHDSFVGNEADLEHLVAFLLDAYDRAVRNVQALGFDGWDDCVVHSDWHPGNLLFRKDRVAAVVDYDSVRWSPRVIDVANAALQFSITSGEDPAKWPDNVDEERFQSFMCGYQSVTSIGDAEFKAIPDLMMEALISECVTPITQTGSVGRWAGYRVLRMVKRKVEWMSRNSDRLLNCAR